MDGGHLISLTARHNGAGLKLRVPKKSPQPSRNAKQQSCARRQQISARLGAKQSSLQESL